MATYSEIERMLREKVAGKIDRPDVPDKVWDHQDVKECANATIAGYDPRTEWEGAKDEVDDLLGVVNREMEVYGGESHSHPGRSATREWNGEFNRNELLRSKALNEHHARHASDSVSLQKFRFMLRSGGSYPHLREAESVGLTVGQSSAIMRSKLTSRPSIKPEEYTPLTDEEASSLLASKATRCMSFDQFKEWDIPVIGHKVHTWRPADSAIPEGLAEHKGKKEWLTFEDPERCFILRTPETSLVIDGFRLDTSRPAPKYPVQTHAGDTEEAVLMAMIELGELRSPEGLREDQINRLPGIRAKLEEREALLPVKRTIHTFISNELRFPVFDEQEQWTIEECDVWSGSVLDELRILSESLAKQYHWEQPWAVWFVLTGEKPPIRALQASTHTIGGGDFTDAYIEIKVLPWVSSKTLLELYKQIQGSLFGGDNQPIRARNLELFRFVEKQRRNDGTLPTWRALLKQWNASRPGDWDTTSPKQEWEYTNERIMHRDYKRVRERLLDFDYTAASMAMQEGEDELDA